MKEKYVQYVSVCVCKKFNFVNETDNCIYLGSYI